MMSSMRTTLTLDDDVAKKLRELAHRRRVPFKEVVNSVLRRGLAAQESRAHSGRRFRVDVFRSSFRPGVDPLKLNQLGDELEAQRFARAERPRASP
jgi:hypothetical protein